MLNNRTSSKPKYLIFMYPKFDILNDVEHHNWSLVNLATFVGSDKILLWALSEGGDFALETKDGWDCILLAIWQGHYQSIYLYLYKF